MSPIRVMKFASTTVKASEKIQFVDGKVTKRKRRLKITRTQGTLFEAVLPFLSISGSVTVSEEQDLPMPGGKRRRLVQKDAMKGLPEAPRLIEGPPSGRKKLGKW